MKPLMMFVMFLISLSISSKSFAELSVPMPGDGSGKMKIFCPNDLKYELIDAIVVHTNNPSLATLDIGGVYKMVSIVGCTIVN